MINETVVRGYRIVGERKPERELSFAYLQLSHDAASAQTALREAVAKNGSNCLGREDEFSGEILMTDAQAKRECLGCPVWTECDIFKRLAHPAWGTWASEVKGRGTMEEVEDFGDRT